MDILTLVVSAVVLQDAVKAGSGSRTFLCHRHPRSETLTVIQTTSLNENVKEYIKCTIPLSTNENHIKYANGYII